MEVEKKKRQGIFILFSYGTYCFEGLEVRNTSEMEIAIVEEGFRRQDNRPIQPKKGYFITLFYVNILDSQGQMESATVLLGLQKMYGDFNMRFKSIKQAEAVKLALKREKDILAVIPTGGGKSLIFQLPAFLEMDLTTVVIIPFVALVEEMKERCQDLGLSCQVWKGKSDNGERSQILIVGVEHAVTQEFQQLLIQLESTENLGRIVLDECQILLTQRDFRPVMRRLGSVVRCVSVQLILLTATLPVGMEERIRIILGCEEWIVVRLTEDRKELKYIVKDVGEKVHSLKDLNEEVAKVMSTGLQQFQELDRGIIYCLKKSWTEELSDFINQRFGEEVCGVYHAEMDLMERQQAFKRWKNGEIIFLAATSALGMGIDYGQVRLVIHHGYGRSLIDFCQESGRGGRDGKKSEVVTVFWNGILNATEWIQEEERKEVLEWIKSKDCRRKELNLYLNNVGEDCLMRKDVEICDNCEMALEYGGELKVDNGKSSKRGREKEWMEIKEGSDLKEMISELRGKCMICWLNGKDDVGRHELPKCR